MPSSAFSDESSRILPMEEQRALQMAIEMLGVQEPASLNLQLNEWEHYDDMRFHASSKRSQNMTECVPVPSSEHVAEIVGRQGCKIKALRAKTNTYIKTPVRGEEPVFVVTGRKEDVATAKREILSAAEHFSQIRASRKSSLTSQGVGAASPGLVPPPPVPGQITIEVRVPYRVVGLVVGPKGATIKRIQQQTSTYIVTPSREKEPIFEVTGLPDNVEVAKREIEAHIALRTGIISMPVDPNPWDNLINLPGLGGSSLFGSASGSSPPNPMAPIGSGISSNSKLTSDLFGPSALYDSDEGIGSDSPVLGPSFIQPNIWSADYGLTASGKRNSSFGLASTGEHQPARRINSDPVSLVSSAFASFSLGDSDSGTQDSGSASPVASPVASAMSSSRSSTRGSLKRECILCCEGEVVAALVPCGHNLFCMTCAQRLVDAEQESGTAGECPVCHQNVSQAIRIFS